MLDPDEMAAFEAWKERKLTTNPDLSVHQFNLEMAAQANAYDEALEEVIGKEDWQKLQSYKSRNPYRQPGMRGHIAGSVLPPTGAIAAPTTPTE